MIGDPGCPNCATNPGTLCTDPRFICSPADGHDHPHLLNWMRYELLDMAGNLIQLGGKKSFCVRDNRCVAGVPAFSCTNQGLSAGCVDDYPPYLGCQYLDVSAVPRAATRAFRLRAQVDPDHEMPDADRANDVTEVVVPGCGDGTLADGEECDPGASPADPCCRNDCRLAAPGSCEPAPSVCGNADVPVADGTPCGSGTPPCLAQVCRDGICVGELAAAAGCLIGAMCVVPGTADPLNACQRCEPAARADAWSLDRDPDVEGLRCQVGRITNAVTQVVCRFGVRRTLLFRLDRVDLLLGRRAASTGRRAKRLDRRLDRQIDRLIQTRRHAATRGCAVDRIAGEVDALVQQFQAFVAGVER